MKHVVKMRNNVYNKIPSVVNLLIAAAITCSSSPFWPMHIFFFFLTILFIYLFLAVLCVHCCTGFFSSCGECGLLSSCRVWAPHCSGFFCGARALGHVGFSS